MVRISVRALICRLVRAKPSSIRKFVGQLQVAAVRRTYPTVPQIRVFQSWISGFPLQGLCIVRPRETNCVQCVSRRVTESRIFLNRCFWELPYAEEARVILDRSPTAGRCSSIGSLRSGSHNSIFIQSPSILPACLQSSLSIRASVSFICLAG